MQMQFLVTQYLRRKIQLVLFKHAQTINTKQQLLINNRTDVNVLDVQNENMYNLFCK